MKATSTLRMGLVLLYAALCPGCRGNADSGPADDPITATDSVTDLPRYIPADDPRAVAGVYICKSAHAKRFHYSESCVGLQRCTHKIEKVSVEEAQGYGLTECWREKK